MPEISESACMRVWERKCVCEPEWHDSVNSARPRLFNCVVRTRPLLYVESQVLPSAMYHACCGVTRPYLCAI